MQTLLFTLLLALASTAGAAWNQKRATGTAGSPPAIQEVVVHTRQAPHAACVRILSPGHKHAWACPALQKVRQAQHQPPWR